MRIPLECDRSPSMGSSGSEPLSRSIELGPYSVDSVFIESSMIPDPLDVEADAGDAALEADLSDVTLVLELGGRTFGAG